MILKGYILSLIYGLLCLAVAFIAYKLGLDKKYTRKIVHILVGFEWLILYHFMGASIHFVAVCLIFTVLVAFAYFSKTMPMISSDSENSAGTVYYCISMTLMSIVSLFIGNAVLSFGVAVFCTSFGDGFAGVIGQSMRKYNPKIYSNKTLFGTLSNFIFSLITALAFLLIFDFNVNFGYIFIIALAATEAELFIGKGLDNLALPLSVFALSLFLLNVENSFSYIIPIILTPIIIFTVLHKRWLNTGGLICAIVLDVIVSLAFGNFGFVFVLFFLVGGTLMDKLKKGRSSVERIEGKSGARNFYQVFANALMPALCSVLFIITEHNIFLFAFCVAVTEAFADTAASAFGVFSKSTFDLFKMKKCEKGISGGVSAIGTSSALVICIVMSLISYAFTELSIYACILICLSSFAGIFTDTFLGSVFQVKYMCMLCGNITEKSVCCNTECKKHSGLLFVKNETVNLISSALTVIVSAVIYILIV